MSKIIQFQEVVHEPNHHNFFLMVLTDDGRIFKKSCEGTLDSKWSEIELPNDLKATKKEQ